MLCTKYTSLGRQEKFLKFDIVLDGSIVLKLQFQPPFPAI